LQWELAVLVEITWASSSSTPTASAPASIRSCGGPLGIMTTNQYAVIQALQVGLGVLLAPT